jgi:hypothetical protein
MYSIKLAFLIPSLLQAAGVTGVMHLILWTHAPFRSMIRPGSKHAQAAATRLWKMCLAASQLIMCQTSLRSSLLRTRPLMCSMYIDS